MTTHQQSRRRIPVAIGCQNLSATLTGVPSVLTTFLKGASKFENSQVRVVPVGAPAAVRGLNSIKPTLWFRLLRIRVIRIMWEQLVLPLLLRRLKATVYHGFSYIIPYLTPCRSIVNVYDCQVYTYPHLCKLSNVLSFRLCLPYTIRRASIIIVPTIHVRHELEQRFKHAAGKIRVIPPPIGEHFHPISNDRSERVRDKYKLPLHFVLCVSQIEPKKNIERLILDFVSAQREGGFSHKLILVGRMGWGHRKVRELIESHSGAVRYLGYVPDGEELAAIYGMATLVVSPSITEGYGLSPAESMACGTPVLISDAPALVETFAAAAEVFKLGDSQGLVHAFVRLLGDGTRLRHLSDVGSTWGEGRTTAAYVKAMYELYEELAIAKKRCHRVEECS